MSPRVASLLLALLVAAAAPAWGKSSDRNQPMDLSSDTSDCVVTDAAAPCVFAGNVQITQGTLDVQADRAEVTSRDGDISRVVLTGTPARMHQKLDDGSPINAHASRIDYDVSSDTVTLTGNAHVDQPRGNMSGQRIVYNLATGRVESGGEGSGRVQMRIQPRARPGRDGD